MLKVDNIIPLWRVVFGIRVIRELFYKFLATSYDYSELKVLDWLHPTTFIGLIGLMNKAFKDFLDMFVIVFINDILVYSNDSHQSHPSPDDSAPCIAAAQHAPRS